MLKPSRVPLTSSKLFLRSKSIFYPGGSSLKQKSVAKHGNHEEGAGIDRKLHDPVADPRIPRDPLDLGQIPPITDLVGALCKTASPGPQPGEARDVLGGMARDKACF